jgi:predicted  nucleic acid-binding Zn-ribbon protein
MRQSVYNDLDYVLDRLDRDVRSDAEAGETSEIDRLVDEIEDMKRDVSSIDDEVRDLKDTVEEIKAQWKNESFNDLADFLDANFEKIIEKLEEISNKLY